MFIYFYSRLSSRYEEFSIHDGRTIKMEYQFQLANQVVNTLEKAEMFS